MKKILDRIIFVICIALTLILTVFMILGIVWKGKNTPYLLGYSVVKVISGSMEPAIHTNSYILLHEYQEGDSLMVDDVIMFHSKDPEILGNLNTHRIIEIRDENGESVFITKGDNNPESDDFPVAADDISGKFVRVMPVITFIGNLISKPLGFFAAVFIPICIYIAMIMSDLLRTQNDKKEKRSKEAVRVQMQKMLESGEMEELLKGSNIPIYSANIAQSDETASPDADIKPIESQNEVKENASKIENLPIEKKDPQD